MRLIHQALVAAILAAAVLPISSCSSPSASIPANKKEVMDRFVAGTLDPSYAPAAFFAHFSGPKTGEPAV